MMKKGFLFFLSVIGVACNAQSFLYEAKVVTDDSSGFYKIFIAPEINSKLHEGFIDLRLFDNDGKETPYLLTTEEATKTNQKFIEYKIIESILFTDSISKITIHNETKAKIDNISLRIKNAEVRKQIKLSGSDDIMYWYVVKEYAEFNSINNTSDVSEIKLIDFPLSNYEYYRVEINDKNIKPVNILSAGYDESITTNGAYTEIESHNMLYADSLRTKTSWVRLPFKDNSIVDFMTLIVGLPKYYLRRIDCYRVESYKNGKPVLHYLKTFDIKSGEENKIIFRPAKAQEFVLCIHNEDNPSLKFSEIKCFQLNRYALAYLEKSKSYTLRFGNDSVTSPTYDLKYFQNLIRGDVPVIKTQVVQKIKQHEGTQNKPYTFFTDKRFIWIMVGLIIIFLGIITFRILRE